LKEVKYSIIHWLCTECLY